jgi:hypothetical protein
MRDPEEATEAQVDRKPLWTDKRTENGPFDVIGDVHGCHRELVELLRAMGYSASSDGLEAVPPNGRRAVFVGDFVDRGPETPKVLRLVMGMAERGFAICLPGNHDVKLVRKLKGRDVQITHGLGESLEQLQAEPEEFTEQAREFLDELVSHVVLDGGDLVDAFLRFHAAPRTGAVYNFGGGRHSNCSMLEAIELCERIAGRELAWELSDRARTGDHRWWISDLSEFEADYSDWAPEYDVEGILLEIYEANVEMWAARA